MVVETIDASLIEKLFALNAERIDAIEVNFIDEYYENIGKNDVDFLSTNKHLKKLSDRQKMIAYHNEFKVLTDIGNKYRIRHHETDRIDSTDVRYYDYFFNRCLSLIALAIQYLR